MKRYRALLFTFSTLVLFRLVLAGDCGNGLPCGSIPWPQPNPPPLQSPTPMPTIGVTTIPPTQTPGGPTATPAPTSASFNVDVSGINDKFATLQSLAGATDIPVQISGTPVSSNQQLATLASGGYTFFGYMRGVSELDLGGLTPLIAFLMVSFITVVAVKSITFILPVLVAVFNFIKGVIGIVLDFLPF